MDLGETVVDRPYLETVRALHQTVVALRSALEQSRSEILELKQRAWPDETLEKALKNLSIENHVLRSNLLKSKENDDVPLKSPQKHVKILTPPLVDSPRTEESSPKVPETASNNLIEISIAVEKLSSKKVSQSLENITIVNYPTTSTPVKKLGISKTLSFSNIFSSEMTDYRDDANSTSASPRHNMLTSRTISSPMNVSSSPNISVTEAGSLNLHNSVTLENAQSEPMLQNRSSNDLDQNEEVDDIELIFTTEETKDSDFKEELVPIETDGLNRVSASII